MTQIFKVLTFFVLTFLFTFCNNELKKETKNAQIISSQKPIMKMGYFRKAGYMSLILREKNVFTLELSWFFASGTYSQSNDTIELNYFDTPKIQNQRDSVIVNLKDSSVIYKSSRFKPYWAVKVLPLY